MYRLNYCQPGALPPFRAFALTAREGLVALPRVSLPSVAGPGLQALPPAEVEGWPSAILNAAYGAYTMETICGTTHCDCLPDSNNSGWQTLRYPTGVWQMEGLVGTARRENRTGNRPISVEVGLNVIFRKKFTGIGDFVVSLP